ncbi:CDP-alcohol phosphatidyltransferase-like enzyme [Mumia flava]|uniref:CDP-alcohol phosphatidyltransferase-like enzyme n=1 Tax=Mumia flava TaxID=1348852 RepID=A0A0B2BBD5_9ACTN|nr:CDP-alcohol phosphatidyltransferase family protein [Mumia flava]PJJ53935.1 CDP-alcohol phosphatidyltransferase-like enzyme [Mumia flava]
MPQSSPRPDRPTLAEYRAIAQPPEVRARRSAEHWVADLYLRDLSPYVSRPLVRLGLSANAVTYVMILTGWAAAGALLIPGIAGAVVGVVLGQLQMLLDCSDGEVARWRNTFSPVGTFLDKIAHYTTESLIPIALGVRAAGGLGDLDGHYGWTTLGALLAVVILLNKALNDFVHVSRTFSGLPRVADSAETAAPRPGLVARLRRIARFVPFHRLYHSVEMTLLVLVAAVVDVVAGSAWGGLAGTRTLLVVLLPLSVLAVVGHFVTILASSRLRA